MPGLTIDQLIFKGTHNSYANGGRQAPWMNHAPAKQIDGFGVWSIELDYSIEVERGGPVAIVGHDRGGERAGWGRYLADYLAPILDTKALAYRPVFLCLDVKRWKRRWLTPWSRPLDWRFSWQNKREAGMQTLQTICGDRLVVLEDWLAEHDWRWPAPGELAGKIVLYEPGKRDDAGRLVGMQGTWAGRFVRPFEVEYTIETGTPIARRAWPCDGGTRIPRLDQYQADWTFDYGVPPNPIVVDANAPESTRVDDAEGGRWRFGDERSHGQVVGRHGTWRFPYRTLAEALERARGITSLTNGDPDPRRAGEGWTVLLRPSSHYEAENAVDFPLRVVRNQEP
jgi:hypothetical protein